MGSPARTRTRKTAQSKDKAGQPEPITQEEIDLAAAQENNDYLQAQLAYLQNRVGQLRIEVNRLTKALEKATADSE